MMQVGPGREAPPSLFSPASLFAIARRQYLLILLGGLLGLMVGVIRAANFEPTFTASATLLVDGRKVRVMQDAYAFSNEDVSLDIEIASQLEVLRSQKIAEAIVDRVGVPPPPPPELPLSSKLMRLLDPVFSRLGIAVPVEAAAPLIASAPQSAQPLARDVTQASSQSSALTPAQRAEIGYALRSGLVARRVPRTQVIELSYTSFNPQWAARVTNAYAEGFIDEQRRTQKQAAVQASEWLDRRLVELRTIVLETEQSIERYKAHRGLLAAEGRLIEEQRLGEISRRLTTARAELSNAQIRFAKLESMIKGTASDAVAQELPSGNLIAQLRARLVQIEGSERSLVARYGNGHDAVKRLAAQRVELQRQIKGELDRLAAGMRGQVEIAKAIEQELSNEYDKLAKSSTIQGEAQVELRELERRGDAYKAIYSAVLTRYQAALQQQSFDDRAARVVTEASAPEFSSRPSPARGLAMALAVGLMLGATAGVAREWVANTFRSRVEVRSLLGIEPVWVLPRVAAAPVQEATADDDAGVRTIVRPGAVSFALGNPESYFVGTLDALKLEIARRLPGTGCRKIGVLSTVGDEARATLTVCLATSIAASGARTLLIDADISGRRMSKALAPDAEAGLAEVIRREAKLEDALYTDPQTGLTFLPAAAPGRAVVLRPADLLGSSAMHDWLDDVATRFDYVIFDVPPLCEGLEARALSDKLGAVVLAIAWMHTRRNLVSSALEEEGWIREKLAGAVLTRANLRQLRRYDGVDIRGGSKPV